MSIRRSDPRLERAEMLAGEKYKGMLRDKKYALEMLLTSDLDLREAAVLICETCWGCLPDEGLVEACCSLANSDINEAGQISAINSLGRMLRVTQSQEISCFLAEIVVSPNKSFEVKLVAYWALREVQYGCEGDPDFLKGMISTVRSIQRQYPGKFSEDTIKRTLAPQPNFPKDFWDTAEIVDEDFVKQFLREEEKDRSETK